LVLFSMLKKGYDNILLYTIYVDLEF